MIWKIETCDIEIEIVKLYGDLPPHPVGLMEGGEGVSLDGCQFLKLSMLLTFDMSLVKFKKGPCCRGFADGEGLIRYNNKGVVLQNCGRIKGLAVGEGGSI